MSLRSRIEWFGRMALLLFILSSAAFLSALMAMRIAIQGREVQVPDLVGKKMAQARTMVASRGLGLEIADHIYSDLPVDAVVRQSPPAGMRVKVGQRAHVVLSLGPQKVSIPALTDKSLRAARLELLSNGLQLGEVSSLYLTQAPSDTVVEQDPLPGSTGASSPKVDVLVSLGTPPAAYVMPELVGMPLIEAQRKLYAGGLHVAKINFAPAAAPDAVHGAVSVQTPPRGAKVDASTPIELQVAE